MAPTIGDSSQIGAHQRNSALNAEPSALKDPLSGGLGKGGGSLEPGIWGLWDLGGK
jgi:hypothetical protein